MSDETLVKTLAGILRTPQDIADYWICAMEAETGMTATDEDRAAALAMVERDIAALRDAGTSAGSAARVAPQES